MLRTILLTLFFFSCSPEPVPQQMVPVIQAGITEAIERAKCAGYTKNLSPSYYKVRIVKGEMRGEIPVFRVNNDGYNGTEFDQGGFQFAAGQFDPPNTLVFPAYTNNFAALKDVVVHEMAHAVYFHNDKAKYEATKVHRAGEDFNLPPCK